MGPVKAEQRIVLVAEDNDDDVETLKLALRRRHMEPLCRFVYNGEEAIAYMRGKAPFCDRAAHPFPAVLVLDLNLPKVDGFGVLEWMGKAPKCESIKVVVWSGCHYGEQENRARNAGAEWFVKKDVGGPGLTELLALICDIPPSGSPEVEEKDGVAVV